MNASSKCQARSFDEAMTALRYVKAAFDALIMEAEAEGRSRLAAGRPDFVQLIEPLHHLKSGLAVVEALENSLNDVRDAPESQMQAVIDKIAVALSGINAARANVKH